MSNYGYFKIMLFRVDFGVEKSNLYKSHCQLVQFTYWSRRYIEIVHGLVVKLFHMVQSFSCGFLVNNSVVAPLPNFHSSSLYILLSALITVYMWYHVMQHMNTSILFSSSNDVAIFWDRGCISLSLSWIIFIDFVVCNTLHRPWYYGSWNG